MDLKFSHTNRGFERYDFIDLYGEKCSLQKSSLATDDAIWLGCDEPKTHHVTGSVLGRMHLNREQVAALMPILHHFMMTGEVTDQPAYALIDERPPTEAKAAKVIADLRLAATDLEADGWIANAAICRNAANLLTTAAENLAAMTAERNRMRNAAATINGEVCQILGKVLGYPWFKDDQKNFPSATEADGVCVGDHVAQSIAAEAAEKLAKAEAEIEHLKAYANHERSLGAEGPMIELVGTRQQLGAMRERAEKAEAECAAAAERAHEEGMETAALVANATSRAAAARIREAATAIRERKPQENKKSRGGASVNTEEKKT